MKTVLTENEANRIPVDAVSLAFQKLQFDGQDDADRAAARHFLLKGLAKAVNGPLNKLEDAIKDAYKKGGKKVNMTKNYRIECEEGTPRELFDLEAFITKIMEAYPQVAAFKLRELAVASTKNSAAPISITVEYIGDVPRDEKEEGDADGEAG